MDIRMLRFVLVMSILDTAGCAETTAIRTYPTGTSIVVNGLLIGTGPLEYRISRTQIPTGGIFHYRAERAGYRPVEGEFRTRVAGGRVAGSIFTLGILLLFKSPSALPERVDIVLEPETPSPATLPATDPGARLKRLERLRDQGVISDEEYRRERSKLLHVL